MQFIRFWRNQRLAGLFARALSGLRRPGRRWLLTAALGAAGAVVVVALIGYGAYDRAGPSTEPVTLIIPEGAGVSAIGRQLRAAGVIESRFVFSAGARLTGRDRRIRAGEYTFPAGMSARGAIALLVSGETVKRRLTIAEGLTTAQSLALIAEADGLTGDMPPPPDEGALMPDTYFFSYGDRRDALIERMRRKLTETLDQLWLERAPDLAVRSKEEALVLASIIEKETGIESERRRISAVFHNRLRKRMHLQSDPTVVYALTNGRGPLDRALRFKDLEVSSPYNTYKVYGLPPRPIANPGRAAIEAAMNPADSDELYFVADGNGGHVFARTLEEHNRNVAKWRRIKRQRLREQRRNRANGEAQGE